MFCSIKSSTSFHDLKKLVANYLAVQFLALENHLSVSHGPLETLAEELSTSQLIDII